MVQYYPWCNFYYSMFFIIIMNLEKRKNRVTNTGFTILQQHNLVKLKTKTADKKEDRPSSDRKVIKLLPCFCHHDILITTRSKMTTAIRFSRQDDTSSRVHITRLVIILVLGRFPPIRTGRPDHYRNSYFDNEIGFFQGFFAEEPSPSCILFRI